MLLCTSSVGSYTPLIAVALIPSAPWMRKHDAAERLVDLIGMSFGTIIVSVIGMTDLTVAGGTFDLLTSGTFDGSTCLDCGLVGVSTIGDFSYTQSI